MNSKAINFLGIIIVFIGLFLLMSLHISHHLLQESSIEEKDHEESEKLESWYHIAVGFPVSILGVLLLILAEKQEKNN